MKYLCIALIGLLIMSCGTSPEEKAEKKKKEDIEKIKANALTFLLNSSKKDPEGIIIDSIELLKIDTLTELLDSTHSMNSYMQNFTRLKKYREILVSEVKNRAEFAEISEKFNMDPSSWEDDAKTKYKKSMEIGKYALTLLDHIEKLDSLIKIKAYDSKTPTGYLAIVNAYAHNKDMVSRDLDSIYIPLKLNLMINDRISKIQEINFDKF